MIRIAHFSDLHYGTKKLQEADCCFGAAIDEAIRRVVTAAVISGDATDHALDLHAPAAQRLMEQVRRLADHCPVLMLQGTFSHEPLGTLRNFSLLGGRFPVQVVERIGQVALSADGQWLASSGWRFDSVPAQCQAVFSCLPTVNKAAVASLVGATQAANAVGENLATVLQGFAPGHRAACLAGIPTLGVAHGTVLGCRSEYGVPMAGFDHEFTTGMLFAAGAQAFLLGHIHQHQRWDSKGQYGPQCIAYAGSIGRFHFGEEGDKGWLLWQLDSQRVACRLITTPAQPTLDIVLEGKPDLAALQAQLRNHSLHGTRVRVRWQVAEEEAASVDRGALQRLLSDAAEVKFEGRVMPLARTRSAGIATLPTFADKVRAWATVTDVSCDELLACLNALLQQTPEQIVQQLLQMPAEGGPAPCNPCT